MKQKETWKPILQKFQKKIEDGVMFLKKTKGNKKRAIVIGIVSLGLLAGSVWYYKANTITLYQVQAEGQTLGYISSPDVVEQWIKEQAERLTQQYGVAMTTDIVLAYEKDRVFRGESKNTYILDQLKDLAKFEAVGAAIIVDDKVIGYVKDESTAEELLNTYKEKYMEISKEKTVRVSSIDSKEIQREFIDVDFKEQVEIDKDERVQPEEILSAEEILALISSGEVAQVTHQVEEGESLWTIARKYDLTVEELQDLNPDIDSEWIQIDQELKVTALQPRVSVITTEEVVKQEVIPYTVKVEEDPNMFKGTSKVKVQGIDGEKTVTYQEIKENGLTKSVEVVEEKVTKEAVIQVVIKGTKVIPSRGTGDFLWPTNGGKITSMYGPRLGRTHAGLDIARAKNKDIKASDNGVVESAGWDGGYGYSIVVDHNNGYKTRYAHLSKLLVKKGQVVERGKTIGIMGSTGNSTGTHLHFEIIKNGNDVDPLKILD